MDLSPPHVRIAVCCCFTLLVSSLAGAEEVDFRRDILPLLSDRCYACHGPDDANREADLRLDEARHAYQSVIVPGDVTASELIERIEADDESQMPPRDSGKSLSQREIALLRQWVADGAVYQRHWAFVPPERPTMPDPVFEAWGENPIDAFVARRMAEHNLAPSPEADRAMLIRRVTLDLTGLPPTPEEVDAFLSDESPQAYERVVDRLLASPRFGERMAVPWLDASRYADTTGYQADWERYQWRWRGWVIDAYNANMPFDQFTIEQLAGDLLPSPSTEQLIATGFNRNHRINDEAGIIPEEYLVEYIVDRVETTSATWMGLTMGCARCHDHKYDPFSQREFYELFAIFNRVPEKGREGRKGYATPHIRVAVRGKQAEYDRLQQHVAELKAALDRAKAKPPANESAVSAAAPEDSTGSTGTAAKGTGATEGEATESEKQWNAASEQLKKFEKESTTYVTVMQEMEKPRATHILKRGVYDQPGERVTAGVPSAQLGDLPKGAPRSRLGLAKWLVSGEHPLTARVVVNRYWAMLFGTGLVSTIEDFGRQGAFPTHPDLLDWLATEYPRKGWDTKAMLKLMVTSRTYRQSSTVSPHHLQQDPANRWLARAPRLRLPAEVIRDQALFASGLLVERIGGPSVKPYQPAGLWSELSFANKAQGRTTDFYVQGKGDELYRRSLYTFWKRTVPPPTLAMFDAPSREMCTVSRSRTNTPLQALAIMNDVTFVEAARLLAQRVTTEHPGDHVAQLKKAFQRTLARSPSTNELKLLAEGYSQWLEHFNSNKAAAAALASVGEAPVVEGIDQSASAALTTCCMNILNLDETINRE